MSEPERCPTCGSADPAICRRSPDPDHQGHPHDRTPPIVCCPNPFHTPTPDEPKRITSCHDCGWNLGVDHMQERVGDGIPDNGLSYLPDGGR